MTEAALSFRFSACYGARKVLDSVAASIAPGEIVSLFGLSGSGKSTLALSLLRLLQHRGGTVSGSIRLEGTELIGLSESALRKLRGRRIGYVPQNASSALNPRLRVRTLLEETWKAHATGPIPEGVLAAVQLEPNAALLDQRAGELSTGQGQRLLIALAILHSPALLIADEATSALDPITQVAILNLFERLNRERGTAVLFISHDLRSASAISHRIDILHEGRIVESGTPSKIFWMPEHAFTKELVAAMPRLPVERSLA